MTPELLGKMFDHDFADTCSDEERGPPSAQAETFLVFGLKECAQKKSCLLVTQNILKSFWWLVMVVGG